MLVLLRKLISISKYKKPVHHCKIYSEYNSGLVPNIILIYTFNR